MDSGQWLVSSQRGAVPRFCLEETENSNEVIQEFTQSLVLGMFPTLGFLLAVWLAFRADVKLASTLVLGYVTWGVGVLILIGLKR